MALCSMNRNSASRPDGFGPSFYQAAWRTVDPNMLSLMQAFHIRSAQLERINQAYVVLIQKPGKINTPEWFPPHIPTEVLHERNH